MKGPPPAVDFDVAPFLVIWETTQACALACPSREQLAAGCLTD